MCKEKENRGGSYCVYAEILITTIHDNFKLLKINIEALMYMVDEDGLGEIELDEFKELVHLLLVEIKDLVFIRLNPYLLEVLQVVVGDLLLSRAEGPKLHSNLSIVLGEFFIIGRGDAGLPKVDENDITQVDNANLPKAVRPHDDIGFMGGDLMAVIMKNDKDER